MKATIAILAVLVLAIALVGQSTTTYLNPVAPTSCPVPPLTTGVTLCATADPTSPFYVTPAGSTAYQPLTTAPVSSVTSFNGRTGAVRSPIGGATLQCTTIMGTITIGANGAVTITNAVGTGCNL